MPSLRVSWGWFCLTNSPWWTWQASLWRCPRATLGPESQRTLPTLIFDWKTLLKSGNFRTVQSSIALRMHCVAILQNFLCSYGVKANLLVDDTAVAISELKMFKQAGGGTLCDISPFGVRWVVSTMTFWLWMSLNFNTWGKEEQLHRMKWQAELVCARLHLFKREIFKNN